MMRLSQTRKGALVFSVAAALLLCFSLARADDALNVREEPRDIPAFKSYRDIPGVTEEEREAIEILRRQRSSFVYGMVMSSELFRRADGNYGGYAPLFCEWLSGLFGIPFKPVDYAWNDLLEDITAMKVDFSGDLTSTQERLKRYWMTSPIAERTLKVMRLVGSESVEEKTGGRPRFGFLAQSATVNVVRATLGAPFDIIYAQNHEEAYRMLKSGAVDAIVDEGPFEAAFDDYPDVTAETLFPLVYEPVSLTTGNPELAPVISVVEKALRNGALKYLNGLYRQGLREYKRHKFFLTLTEEEKGYIREHGPEGAPVPVGVKRDNYPVIFYNEAERKWQGASLDILAEISDVSGLRFAWTHTKTETWTDTLRALENGEIPLVVELIRTPHREERFLWTDTPYLTDNFAMLSRADTPNIAINEVLQARIGLTRDSACTEIFHQWFPGHVNTVEYEDNLKAFEGLERGEVDLLMASQNLLLCLTNYLEKPYFKANIIFRRSYSSFFGVNKKEKILLSIINKAQRLVDYRDVVDGWKSRIFDYQAALARARSPLLAGSLVLLLLVIILLSKVVIKSRRTGRELENAVQERTRDLERQTRLAEEASRAKDTFLTRMSHEIRTPMNAIIGMSELAQREYGTSRALEYIVNIKTAGANLLSIINDILDFSKIESGNMQIISVPYETASLLNDVLTIIRVRLVDKPVEMLTSIDPAIPAHMTGDSARIRQILVNLLSNAEKYTEQGFIKFSVSGKREGEDSIRLTFSVEDSGIGIKKENMARLFESFARFDERRNRDIEGSGLGLSITRSLCQAMGGELLVTSEYEKGSLFTAVLPQTVTDWSPMGELSQKMQMRQKAQQISFIAPEADVLLVDDLPSNLLVAEGLLSPYRMRLCTCLNGREAVEIVREHAFDLVLMDHMMPNMDGVEATKIIRDLGEADGEKRFREMPVVALTANAVSGMREMFLANGFNDFLAKPIEISKLDSVLKKWIPAFKQQKAPGGADADPSPGEAAVTIPGVDTSLGLSRVGGSRERYLNFLEMFLRDVEARFALLDEIPDEAELSAFTTQIHALKGALANLGAEELSRIAASLESAVRNGDMPAVSHGLVPFRKALGVLRDDIESVLSSLRTGGAGKHAELEAGLLTSLREALRNDDLDATDEILDRLKELPLRPEWRKAVLDIAELVLVADFAQAAEAVDRLADSAKAACP
ncbi:MAG: transporter substrate-binding domain-containing protein [Desulfovibrio sp.]|jgi:signal transduction histidine kinase/HPt (histidine-containing phosphotransfer) domain-containing protein/FixJ family two-component response regulator|nr:transporter substrate-binding domain-containing protein [Desulfovibrio sp.]